MVVCLVTLTNPGDASPIPPPDAAAFRELRLAPAPTPISGLSQLTRIERDEMLVQTDDGDLSFLPGVNLGSTVPGSNPDTPAVTAEQYRTWFPQMAAAGFQVVRVEGLRQPDFYRELLAYNKANRQDPLYLLHGVSMPEGVVNSARDLWHPSVRQDFDEAIDEAVSAANGGNDTTAAANAYTADVGPWIVGWIVGSPLDPHVAQRTNELNLGVTFQGDFIWATSEASPTEVFLAEAMDRVAQRQADFGRMTPVAFNNSAATDPIMHRYEPIVDNDLVQLDANHIESAPGWAGGTFASYHADPYYPEFQRFEPAMSNFKHNGQADPYAGYLNQLAEHHSDMPVMISRFGVPSGHAVARFGPIGRNQGGFDEVTQMAVNSEMMRTIADLGLSGAMLASWVDEWHQTAWNTAAVDVPARRRSMWMNAWAADAHFGVIAAEPGLEPTVVIDGSDAEWDGNGAHVVYEGQGPVRSIRAVHDEGWLYLSISLDDANRLAHGPFSLGFDVIDGAAGTLPTGEAEHAADYALRLFDDQLTLLAAGHADAYRRLNGDRVEWPADAARSAALAATADDTEVDASEGGPGNDDVVTGFADGTPEPGETTPDSLVPARAPESETPSPSPKRPGVEWQPYTLTVRESYEHPATGARQPSESSVTGELIRGTTDRTDPLFDSRASWQMTGSHLEVRLPWQGVGLSDPSNRRAYWVNDDHIVVTTKVERILMTAAVDGRLEAAGDYSWDPWTQVRWHQVPKNGLELVTQVAEQTLHQHLRTPVEGSQ